MCMLAGNEISIFSAIQPEPNKTHTLRCSGKQTNNQPSKEEPYPCCFPRVFQNPSKQLWDHSKIT